jgi:hypothetical protein
MILDWGRNGPLGKQTPILKRDLASVGISVKAHRMTVNLVQVLYVKGVLPSAPGAIMTPQVAVMEQQNPVFVEQPRPPQVIVGGALIGNLKLHLIEAHINHRD